MRRCLVHGDLTALIKSGRPSTEELATTWINIFSEYVDLMEDAEAKYLLQMQSQIAILGAKIIEVDTAIYLLSICWDQRLIDKLAENDVTINLTEDEFLNDHEQYLEALARAGAQIANDRQTFDTLEKDYKRAIESKEDGPIMDDLYFTKMLRRLATYVKAPVIRAEDLYTDEYVLLYRDFVEYIDAHSKQVETDESE